VAPLAARTWRIPESYSLPAFQASTPIPARGRLTPIVSDLPVRIARSPAACMAAPARTMSAALEPAKPLAVEPRAARRFWARATPRSSNFERMVRTTAIRRP